MPAYRILRMFLRFALRVFFRQIAVVGREHIPDEGVPVIFAGNHPNSLLDPVLIITTCGRFVHFAAKDVLFKNPIARAVLSRLGAVPVQRRADHGEGADNRGAFDRLAEVLGGGRAMGIFPEGLSHDLAQLQQLKTGAARIALDVAARGGRPLSIIPCGLNYVRPKRFRSRVLVQYGPPIVVEPLPDGADPREASRELTARIDRALRALTVNAPDWETVRVIDAVRRLYQPPRIPLEDRIELARRFTSVYATVKDAPDVKALYARVEDRLARLDAAGLDERDLARDLRPGEIARRLLRHLALLLIWLPLAAPGFLLHAPVVWLIRVAAGRLAPRKDTEATTKLVLGLLLIPLSLLAVGGIAAWRFGPGIGAATLGLLMLSGYATVRVLERGIRMRRLAATTLRLASFRREVAALREERRALESEVVQLVERHKPADMVALYPRTAAPGTVATAATAEGSFE